MKSEESYLYYFLKRGEDDSREVDSLLELGGRLKDARDFLRKDYPFLSDDFGVDIIDFKFNLSLRFWTVDINEKSFYKSLFRNAGYFNEAEVTSKAGYKLLSEILKEENIPFKKGGGFFSSFFLNKELRIL